MFMDTYTYRICQLTCALEISSMPIAARCEFTLTLWLMAIVMEAAVNEVISHSR